MSSCFSSELLRTCLENFVRKWTRLVICTKKFQENFSVDAVGDAQYLSEFQVVDVPLEVVGYGGYHTGFSRSSRSIQQVAALPWPTHSSKIFLPGDERVKVCLYGLQLRRFYSQRVEGRRVLEVYSLPEVPAHGGRRLAIRVEKHFSAFAKIYGLTTCNLKVGIQGINFGSIANPALAFWKQVVLEMPRDRQYLFLNMKL